MKLTFCGAARIVTGSCYLIETKDQKVLVDCGMFQGPKEITRLNYEDFLFDPAEISCVFLTHAHIDHSGLIPKLVKEGFEGQIITTSATQDLCKVMLEDSADRQIEDTQHENRRRKRMGASPREPLYERGHVREAMKLFKSIGYDQERHFGKVSVRYRDAGHILGSAIIELVCEGKKLVFSGDLGQWNTPIIRDPTLIESADYLFLESTYGDRLHEGVADREDMLLKYAKETHKKGGKLMIPSFAVERTQELLYYINKMLRENKFPNEKIFLDSPLALRATKVFSAHKECYDEKAKEYAHSFDFPNLVKTPKVQDSIKINNYAMPCVVIAGSGMCTGGRIRHHLKHGIWEPKNTLLFIGYQAEGTLGRVILEGAEFIDMMGMTLAVKADIRNIDGFSAHADYSELLKWVDGFLTKPKKIFVVHGEVQASEALGEKLTKKGHKCKIPSIAQSIEL